MKVKELQDDRVVYVFINSNDSFVSEITYLTNKTISGIHNKILEIDPQTDIKIHETVASDLPQYFNVYEEQIKKHTNDICNVKAGWSKTYQNILERRELK